MHESGGELAWFRRELLRSIVHPRDFARTLPREHFGLAGVAVALVCGFAISLAVDWLVLSARGFDPLGFVGRLAVDGVMLGIRLAVTGAAISFLAVVTLRALRRPAATWDQVFTAIVFALTPLLVAPLLAWIIALFPEVFVVVGALGALVFARIVLGLGLNLTAILPRALAALCFGLVIATSTVALADQISRVRMTAYAYAPQLASPLESGPQIGAHTIVEGIEYRLTVPTRWQNATSGAPGEAARFVTQTDTLAVARARGDPFLTTDAYADNVGRAELRGMSEERTERRVVRNAAHVLVDDVTRGVYEGRRVLLRRFTAAEGPLVMALVFRFIEPSDEAAALAESAAIAASWRLVH